MPIFTAGVHEELAVPHRLDDPEAIADACRRHWEDFGMTSGVLVANPAPRTPPRTRRGSTPWSMRVSPRRAPWASTEPTSPPSCWPPWPTRRERWTLDANIALSWPTRPSPPGSRSRWWIRPPRDRRGAFGIGLNYHSGSRRGPAPRPPIPAHPPVLGRFGRNSRWGHAGHTRIDPRFRRRSPRPSVGPPGHLGPFPQDDHRHRHPRLSKGLRASAAPTRRRAGRRTRGGFRRSVHAFGTRRGTQSSTRTAAHGRGRTTQAPTPTKIGWPGALPGGRGDPADRRARGRRLRRPQDVRGAHADRSTAPQSWSIAAAPPPAD